MIPTTAALLLAALAALASASPGVAPAGSAPAVGSGLAVATESVERVPLPPGSRAELTVDAMGATLSLATRDPAAVLRFVAPRLGPLCPNAEVAGAAVRLHCRTRRLAAAIVTGKAGPAVEIRELRGVPWRAGDDGPPWAPWDPAGLGGAACPGVTPAAAGECALARDDRAAAKGHFQSALDGTDHAWAAVRLGDLSLAEDRLEAAIGWWRAAGNTGRFARLATARLCELTGSCLGAREFGGRFDPAGLPDPLGPELELRAARVETFLGRAAPAARRLLAFSSAARVAACDRAGLLCRRIALEALRTATGPEREDALALYLSLAEHDRGPLAVELARAGSEVAASLGAQIFGGNLLAAVAPEVPAPELADHLLRAAELFLSGDDRVRAGVILDFARTRLPAARLAEPRWAAVVTALTARPSSPAPPPAPPVDPELARARTAIERARAVNDATR
jgi:hypothetical protein